MTWPCDRSGHKTSIGADIFSECCWVGLKICFEAMSLYFGLGSVRNQRVCRDFSGKNIQESSCGSCSLPTPQAIGWPTLAAGDNYHGQLEDHEALRRSRTSPSHGLGQLFP